MQFLASHVEIYFSQVLIEQSRFGEADNNEGCGGGVL